MRNKIRVSSEMNVFSVFILIVGGVGSFILTILFINKGIYGEKYDLLFFSLIFLVLGIYIGYCVFKIDILEITKSDFVIKSIFGSTKKKIPLTSLKAMKEIEKEGGDIDFKFKWKELKLFGKDFEYKLTSVTYGNYPELKAIFLREIRKNKLSRVKKK